MVKKLAWLVLGLAILGLVMSLFGGSAKACTPATAGDLEAVNGGWRKRYDLNVTEGWRVDRDGYHFVSVKVPNGIAIFANLDRDGDLWMAANATAKIYSLTGELIADGSTAYYALGGDDLAGMDEAEACAA